MGGRITDSAIADRVREVVLQRVEADDMTLPALPVVVAKCLVLLDDPDLSLRDVTRLIETDPLIAARIVRMANAAARAPIAPIRSIGDCVTRLGVAELRVFLLEQATRQVFESSDRQITHLCRGIWKHSLAVAILTRELLVQTKSRRPEEGYLGGLLHDIGKPVMAAMLLDAEMRLRGSRTLNWLAPLTWLRLISESHRRVGVAVAEKWQLPAAVRSSIRDCSDYDSNDPHSLANAVRLANAIAKWQGLHVEEVDRGEVESLMFVGRALFDVDEEYVKYLTTYLEERVNERLA
jgi:putative nucleotidyltransferase with HDIG domain